MDSSDIDHRPTEHRIVEYLFKANSFETTCLWKEWHSLLTWDERPSVQLPNLFQIGKVAGEPVNVEIIWASLNDHLVGFYWGCSNVVDHKMIRDWLDRNFCPPIPTGGVPRRTDASNFLNGLIALGIDWNDDAQQSPLRIREAKSHPST